MINPVSDLYGRLDRLVEDLSDRAVENAAAPGREARQEPPDEREELLLQVRRHRADAKTPGVRELIELGFVKEQEPDGKLVLTGFGDYLLPAISDEPTDADHIVEEHQQAQAGA